MITIEINISHITIRQIMFEMQTSNEFFKLAKLKVEPYNVTEEDAIKLIYDMADLYIRWKSRDDTHEMEKAIERLRNK